MGFLERRRIRKIVEKVELLIADHNEKSKDFLEIDTSGLSKNFKDRLKLVNQWNALEGKRLQYQLKIAQKGYDLDELVSKYEKISDAPKEIVPTLIKMLQINEKEGKITNQLENLPVEPKTVLDLCYIPDSLVTAEIASKWTRANNFTRKQLNRGIDEQWKWSNGKPVLISEMTKYITLCNVKGKQIDEQIKNQKREEKEKNKGLAAGLGILASFFGGLKKGYRSGGSSRGWRSSYENSHYADGTPKIKGLRKDGSPSMPGIGRGRRY
ncbi:MAG: hypothetical protein ACOQNV_00955 [Mycoplasmoidaceae bacterium]